MVADNIKAGLLTLFLGGFGDLISRVTWYNCSIDRSWTLLFVLPPLSIVSSLMYFFDKVEKSSMSCGSAFDWFLLIIPFFTILTNVLTNEFIESSFITSIISFVVILSLYAMVRMYRVNKVCKESFNNKYKGFNKSIIKKSFFISLVTNLAITIFNILAPYGSFIPIIGIGFRAWNYLRYIPGLQHALILILAHFITNLRENISSKIEDVCILEEYNIGWKDILPSIL